MVGLWAWVFVSQITFLDSIYSLLAYTPLFFANTPFTGTLPSPTFSPRPNTVFSGFDESSRKPGF